MADVENSERERYMDLEVDGSVATIVLNRPAKLNAWSWESASAWRTVRSRGPIPHSRACWG